MPFMKTPRFLPSIVLLANSLWWGACAPQGESSDPSIVGGRQVTAADAGPERVSTVGLSGCTGTIVARDLVLTAAHCYNNALEGGYILFGIQFNGRDRKIVRIADARVFNGYTGPHNDIALLRLAGEIPAGYQAVKILAPGQTLRPGETVRQAGYGSNNQANSFGTLRTVDSIFAGATRSGSLYVENGRTAACSGDSGGPLYVRRGNEWYTAGITSTAYMDNARRCIGGNHYTSVSQNYDIILGMARSLTGRQDPFGAAPNAPKPEPEELNPPKPQPSPQGPARFQVLTDLQQSGRSLAVGLRNVSGRTVGTCVFTLSPVRSFFGLYDVTYDLESTVAASPADITFTLAFTDPYEGMRGLGPIQSYGLRKSCSE